MQGFRSSAPKQSRGDASTIESFIFPEIPLESPANPFDKLRVPLLPDNYNPDRSADSFHAAEELDAALSKSEISVVAAYPDAVTPAALSEVVGNDGLDVDIRQLTTGFLDEDPKEPGALKELFTAIADDLFGVVEKNPQVAI
jgi:hypothetical protein